MSDLLVRLGLRASDSSLITPSYGGHYVIANFVLAFALFSTRGTKTRLGIDHNTNPREDIDKYGPVAVSKGKITQAQLDKLKRQQAAHENAVEHFPFFLGAVVFATQAGLPAEMINKYALLYTIARIGFYVSYSAITDISLSFVRTAFWWSSNILCIRMFWFAQKALNGAYKP